MDTPDDGTGATTVRDPLIGVSVMGYELRHRIGVGGMGVVYEAEESNIGRRAAVKVLLPEIANQPQLVERLKAEARAANAARHRGIIDIFGFATLPDGRNAIVMEYLDGVALDQELSQLAAEGRSMDWLFALQVLDELASVLAAAHAAGVVHRDLKPSNVFLCTARDGSRTVKVLDFGIAKLDQLKSSPLTATNTVLGTPGYMSPEQARGESAAPSMDLYSLGVIAFELFTNRLPFVHESLTRMLLAHQNEPPPRPSSLAPGLPVVLDDFVLKLLAKDPADRYATAEQLRVRIQQVRKVIADPNAVVTAPGVPKAAFIETERVVRAPRVDAAAPTQQALDPVVAPARSPRTLIAALAALVAVLAVSVWVVFRPSGDRPALPAEPTEPVTPTEPAEDLDAGAVAVVTPVEPRPTPAPDAGVAPAPAVDAGTVAVAPVNTPRAPTLDRRRHQLDTRLQKLRTRLDAAAARGESVTLARQQLETLTKGLKSAKDSARLDAIETALSRLEQENK
ncbi:MAG: protein kinase [Myxococcaceae bacterium]